MGAAWRLGLVVRPSTLVRYESHLRLYSLPRFGRLRLSEISRVQARAWARGLADRLAPSTVSSIMALFSGILSEAHREGLMPVNPVDRLRVGATVRSDRVVADAAGVRALVGGMGAVAGLMAVTGGDAVGRVGRLASGERGVGPVRSAQGSGGGGAYPD